MLIADPLAHRRLGGGEIGTGVHADALLGVVGEVYRDALALTPRLGDEVREEDLARVVRAQSLHREPEPIEIGGIRAEVRLLELLLGGCREPRFDDASDVATLVADDPPVRVVGPDLACQEDERRAALTEQRAHTGERFGAYKRGVPVHDERDAVVAVRRGEADPHGVARSEGRGLYRDPRAFIKKPARGRGLLREDDHRTGAHGANGLEDVPEKRAPSDWMEDLRGL